MCERNGEKSKERRKKRCISKGEKLKWEAWKRESWRKGGRKEKRKRLRKKEKKKIMRQKNAN